MNELLHFKSLTDLRDIISDIESFAARPVASGQHPTLYSEVSEGKYRTIMGIRHCDYKFSQDEKWVLPDDQMGLSFSSTWKNLKSVYKLMSRGQGKQVDVYWVLQGSDIPDDMKFVEDRRKKGHFFLTVTKTMQVSKLVENLKWVADRMSVIKNAGCAL